MPTKDADNCSSSAAVISKLCEEFETAIRTFGAAAIEEFLERVAVALRERLLAELLLLEWGYLERVGQPFTLGEYVARFTKHRATVDEAFALFKRRAARSSSDGSIMSSTIGHVAGELEAVLDEPSTMRISGFSVHCPHCHEVQQISGEVGPAEMVCEACGRRFQVVHDAPREQPAVTVGHFVLLARIGFGGFGTVWKARDTKLDRVVALKLLRSNRLDKVGIEQFFAEARTVAKLDHPNIVPVYEVGQTPDGLCYIVSKMIEGRDLAHLMVESTLDIDQAIALVASVAETLAYAHSQGLVHRDIKPGNILVDAAGRAFVADFGLAIHDEDIDTWPGVVGTPDYMSPEQARGEGHRVDGRSDIFSLGALMYELLTGKRPFAAGNRRALVKQLRQYNIRPLRQWNHSIHKELERICLKALAHRAVDRYTNAHDLADDLTDYLEQSKSQRRGATLRTGLNESAAPSATPQSIITGLATSVPIGSAPPSVTPPAGTPPAWEAHGLMTPSLSDSRSRAVKIVPKGMRAFDANDADFFLELLPGPRDRHGLPESIRFWKTRIEAQKGEESFDIGVLYGPSGSGKSSLVKAGLVPHLMPSTAVAYVEATASDTVPRLLKALAEHGAGAAGDEGIADSLSAIRRGGGLRQAGKLLVVIDQFEQWLHAWRPGDGDELIGALRHCDGRRLQCLLLVRDDFWMALTRFMGELEIELVSGRNTAAVDLFGLDHARRVLHAFGHAYGVLPEAIADLTPKQNQFLDQSVAALAEDDRVVCVRLALFAEMVKDKPWTAKTLDSMGGAEGIGMAFLEEMFSSPAANPGHRFHEAAARRVLIALLPEPGEMLKGPMRSYETLLEASGYAARPSEFEELLRILDGQLRLITPTDPGAASPDDVRQIAHPEGERYYQLAHDYLVPALRNWITLKQRQTRRGRAEMCLAERAAGWNSRPEGRNLPSWWEWLNIRLHTRRRRWTEPQHAMMRRANRRYAVWSLCFALVCLAAWAGFERYAAMEWRDRLLITQTAHVPKVVAELPRLRWFIDPVLRDAFENESAHNTQQRLNLALALLPVDREATELACRCVLTDTPPGIAPMILSALETSRRDEAMQWFRARLEELPADESMAAAEVQEISRAIATEAQAKSRASAAAALARLGAPNDAWQLLQDRSKPMARAFLINRLATVDAAHKLIIEQACAEKNPLARQALVLSLGEFTIQQISQNARVTAGDRLLKYCPVESDAGVYSAMAWLFQKWELTDRLKELEGRRPVDGPDFVARLFSPTDAPKQPSHFVTRQNHRMVVLPGPSYFVRVPGPNSTSNEQPEQRQPEARAKDTRTGAAADEKLRFKIDRTFAISATEVTVAQFGAFAKANKLAWRSAWNRPPDTPVVGVNWFHAAQYCNWLSEQEGIPEDKWCYSADEKGMTLSASQLNHVGYRLPTLAEFEYAAQGGIDGARWFGDSDELLPQYVHFVLNTRTGPQITGLLKPNPFGLFDMLGNVNEWCHGTTGDIGAREMLKSTIDRPVTTTLPQKKISPVACGASVESPPANVRCSTRYEYNATSSHNTLGFRIARTIRPSIDARGGP